MGHHYEAKTTGKTMIHKYALYNIAFTLLVMAMLAIKYGQ